MELLSRRGFLFGAAATLAVIRTPGLIMPIKPVATYIDIFGGGERVPFGRVFNFVLERAEWRRRYGYHPEDPDADIRIQHMMQAGGPDLYVPDTEFRAAYVGAQDDGYALPLKRRWTKEEIEAAQNPVKIAKAT